MYVTYLILYFSIVVLCLKWSKDYLSPINFILADTGFRSLLPIIAGGLYFSTDIVDIRMNISLIIQLLGLFFSFYLFNFLATKRHVNNTAAYFSSPRFPVWLVHLFLSGAIFSLCCVFIFGNWSALAWLENPREGYQYGRKGVGLFYILFILFINLSWISFIAGSDKFSNLLKILITLFVFYLAYLSGSKRVMVTLVLFYFLYRNMYVARLKFFQVVGVGFALILSFIVYFLMGSGGLSDIIGYFSYFQTTQEIYGRLEYGLLEFQGGLINSSRVWEFIPRFFYAEKPFVYGGAFVTEIISPGQSEKGHNLGMMDFTAYYLDFGQLGVLMHAVFTGSYAGLIYGMLKKKKSSFVFLLLYLSLFSNILASSPNILFLTLLCCFYITHLFYKQFIRVKQY